MKSILLKALKIFLISTAVILGILLIFGLTLILGWPWWVGFFILIGVLGAILGVIVARKLWLKRREQRFVTQVIEQDNLYRENMGSADRDRTKEIQDRWKEAIAALRKSHLRKQGNPLYVLPWYLIIGESGCGKTTAIQSARLSSTFAEINRTSGISGTRNCDWWFFDQAVVIDTAGRFAIPIDESLDKEEWQKFLNLLAKYRRREPLNGLVVCVAADKLLESPAAELEDDGKRIRQRTDELMRLLGARFPVYVLVTKCDLIQGMQQFCEQLSEENVDQAMGFINMDQDRKIEAAPLLERVIRSVSERLRDYRLLIFSRPITRGGFPAADSSGDPALLLFPEEFERLKPGLTAFLSGAFQENPYQESPYLRGVFFSSGRQEGSPFSHFLKELGMISEREMLPGTNKGLFLHDLFARILPRDRGLFVPTQQRLDWNRLTKNLGLTAWLAVGIAICGLLSYSFVRNLSSIRDVSKTIARSVTVDQNIYTKVSQMEEFRQKIIEISRKNRDWWMPHFGLRQNEKIESGLKQKYCDRFKSNILKQFDQQITTSMAYLTTTSHDVDIATYATHLVRRINLLKNRLAGKRLPKLGEAPLPAYIVIGDSFEPAIVEQLQETFGRLYLHFVGWRADTETLNEERDLLQARLTHLVTKLRTNLQWLIAWADAQPNLSTVDLREFWRVDWLGQDQASVAPAYTARGEGQIFAFIDELESALPGGAPTIARQRKEFEIWYPEQYFEEWHQFGLHFSAGAAAVKGKEDRREMASLMGTDQNPYFQLLERMNLEFQPVLSAEKDAKLPPWAWRVDQLQDVRKAAEKLRAGSAQIKPGIVKKMAKKVKAKVSKLEKQTGLQADRYLNPENQQIAAKAYVDYQSALAAVARDATPRESAYEMGVKIFSEDPNKSETPFYAAKRAVARLVTAMPTSRADSKLFVKLVNGPLDYFQSYIIEECACQVQHLWERDILREVEPIADQYTKIQYLIGKDGIAEKFVKDGGAAPFVAYSGKKRYHARSLGDTKLPFENRFFQFINKRASVAPTVADNYAVTVAGQPINTNPDARILPHAIRLELQCSSGPQQLIYRMYPRSRIFNWSPKGCGNVNLEILVGDMTLTQSFTGGKAFAKFLQTYAQGSLRFAPDDFPPEQSARLKSYGIKYFIVGYRLKDHQPVIRLLGSRQRREPTEIVECKYP